jgi:hypothetical protein
MNEDSVRFVAERKEAEADSMRPRPRCDSHVGISSCDGADHFTMRGKKPSAVVGGERIEARAPQLLVEMRAHASRFRTTRNPPPTNLPQVSHADTRAHRETYLPFDQLDEDDALPVDSGRHVRPMKTCRDHFSAA